MEETEIRLNEIFSYYKKEDPAQNQESLVAMLREIQDLLGCIPVDIQERISEEMGVKQSVTAYIIKLYPGLKQAAYRHRITMCSGERCGRKEGMKLLNLAKKELGISKDGISADGSICLSVQNCFRHCRTSPNMLIDGKLEEYMTEEKLKKKLRELKQKK